MNETIQFQCSVTIKNVSPNAINFSLIIVTEEEGVFSIVNQRSVTQIGAISKDDVLKSDDAPVLSYEAYKASLEGGTFSEDLDWALKNPWDNVIKPVAKELLPVALSGAKKLAGLGMDEEMGGTVYGAAMYGGAKSGGKMMSRKDLKRKLQE